MKLVRFEDMQGRETFVNADRVNFISDYGSGKTELNLEQRKPPFTLKWKSPQ